MLELRISKEKKTIFLNKKLYDKINIFWFILHSLGGLQMDNKKLNILVCDDEKSIVDAIEIYLKQEDYNILKAYDGEEALKVLENNEVHLVIMDIIMLSAKSEDTDKIIGLNFGADDYITKPFNPLELIARVKSHMRRYTALGSIAEKGSIIKIGDLELDKDSKEVRVNGEPVKLTATEYGILQLLMENAGQVFSIDEIYEKVWNELSFAPENTVSVHIRRIREKIEINPKEPRYLKVVWGIGYKIEKI